MEAVFMGVHREARIAQDRSLKKLRADEKQFDQKIADERGLAAENERAGKELAFDATNDRKKLAEQTAFYAKQSEHLRQVENLEQLAAPIRAAIAAAELDLSKYALAEAHETVIETIAGLEPMAKQLSKMIEPVAIAFSGFKKKIDAAAREALPLIARGDEERVRSLVERLRTVMFRAMRAQMASDFHTHGVDFFTGEPFEASTFDGVVAPWLRMMSEALSVDIHANGVPTPGRGQFRCTTNVAGLFGLNLRVGEVVSLPLEDEKVKALISQGTLERIDVVGSAEEAP
jgi:hypothetical protein